MRNYLTESAYRDLIAYLHRLWSKGLISSEAFTHDWSQYTAASEGYDKTAIVGFTWMWTSSDIFGLGLADQYIALSSLKQAVD